MDHDDQSPSSMKGLKCAAMPSPHIKGHMPKVTKALTEHKLKRLNILTFINDKKEILFTKKAFKHEKERIWRQIFQKMLDFGMVSKEKDWRYVRDVSFSNWRKRAQKRLKHLAANGHRLNMDECEFLIYDILGKTPDKIVPGQEQALFAEAVNWMPPNDEDNMDDESDEYMIDSDDDDDEDVSFDEMLFVPKIVFNEKDEMEEEGAQGMGTAPLRQTPSKLQQTLESAKAESDHCKQEGKSMVVVKNGGSVSLVNGGAQRHLFQAKCFNAQASLSEQMNRSKSVMPLGDAANCKFEPNSDQETDMSPSASPSRYMNKFRELRLLDLEIENKVLKNRYMKLKIFQLEQSLGLEHCKEVKDLSEFGGKGSASMPCKTAIQVNFKNTEQSNNNEASAHLKQLSSLVQQAKSSKLRT